MTFCVYEITSSACDGVYVGQTKTPAVRWKTHTTKAKTKGVKGGLYDAMRRHGLPTFTFTQVASFDTLDNAQAEEWRRIQAYVREGREVFNKRTGLNPGNETKRIAVRPNIGSALQRAVDQARDNGTSVSDLIHYHAAVVETTRTRVLKKQERAALREKG